MKSQAHVVSTESRAAANDVSRSGNKSFPAQPVVQKKGENAGGLKKGKTYHHPEAVGPAPDLSKPSELKDQKPHPAGHKGITEEPAQRKAGGSSVIQRVPVINYAANYHGDVNHIPICAAYLMFTYGGLPNTDTLTITNGLHTGHEARSYYGPPDPATGISPLITSLFEVEYFDFRYNGGAIQHYYTGNMTLAV